MTGFVTKAKLFLAGRGFFPVAEIKTSRLECELHVKPSRSLSIEVRKRGEFWLMNEMKRSDAIGIGTFK